MPLIDPVDSDFGVFRISFNDLVDIQCMAEERGWATRWTSVDALRCQVKNGPVVLQSLMREEVGGDVRAYRCLVLFSVVDGVTAGGIATIDVVPATFQSLERIDRDADVRSVLHWIVSLATGGIAMTPKE